MTVRKTVTSDYLNPYDFLTDEDVDEKGDKKVDINTTIDNRTADNTTTDTGLLTYQHVLYL